MTAKAKAKQSDIERVGRAAKKLGAKAVRMRPDGSIDIVFDGDGEPPAELPAEDPNAPLVKFSNKKLVF